MMIAGISVPNNLVQHLAERLDGDPLGAKITTALKREHAILALTTEERETLIRVLDDPPLGLGQLRGVLLRQHVGRKRDGLF